MGYKSLGHPIALPQRTFCCTSYLPVSTVKRSGSQPKRRMLPIGQEHSSLPAAFSSYILTVSTSTPSRNTPSLSSHSSPSASTTNQPARPRVSLVGLHYMIDSAIWRQQTQRRRVSFRQCIEALLHRVSLKKTTRYLIAHNCGKCWPILKRKCSPSNSAVNQ